MRAVAIKFQPILPRERNYPQGTFERLVVGLRYELRFLGGVIRMDMGERTRGWYHPIDFKMVYRDNTRIGNLTGMSITISPGGQNLRFWVFVSAGVKPRTISPRRYPYLRIRKGYRPHTSPSGAYGGSGRYDGPVYRRYGPVSWPGIEARQFERHIVKDRGDMIISRLQAVVRKVLR